LCATTVWHRSASTVPVAYPTVHWEGRLGTDL
jgi:hypothetical protein